jgi:hypothetical protein
MRAIVVEATCAGRRESANLKDTDLFFAAPP